MNDRTEHACKSVNTSQGISVNTTEGISVDTTQGIQEPRRGLMMGWPSTSWLVGLLLALFCVGCVAAESTLQTNEDIIPQLVDEGLVLMHAGVSNFDAFSITGERYQVGAGGMLHLYEYNNENRAALDASRVNPGVMSDAHVFRSGNIVAVYIGGDHGVQSAIASVFGAAIY